ncbi:hypothetical protein [Novosphingobium sp.]|uniref:hypothetical protein n=1 Tax=Novosphingobium sp. TaxID=1874826 RepID=UPI003D0F19E7
MSKPFRKTFETFAAAIALTVITAGASHAAFAQNASDSAALDRLPDPVAPHAPTALPEGEIAGQTYADMVDLALASPVVVKATVRRQTRLEPSDSPGLAPGFVRLYIEADTNAVLVGPVLGESLRFLADIRIAANGKIPRLNKTQVLLFGNAVPGKPGELQLSAADTMFAWSPALETRTRAILTELIAPDAPPRIMALREALHVPGNLVGEGESQFFFTTQGANGSAPPVSISVVRRPGEPTRWGVSFSEIVDQSAQPPRRDTLAWYRLACALPPVMPARAAISSDETDRRIATEDYALILRDLGPCRRNRVTK